MGKNPLPAIRRRMKEVAQKEKKVLKWERKRTCAKMRRGKNRRDAARKLRQEERKTRQGLKREQNRARQLDQAPAASSEKTCLPARKPKAQPVKGLPERVRKILMAAPYNAGKRGMSEKADRARKEAGKKEKKVNSGGRADRSEVIHETPQKRKLVSELLPSKVTFKQEPPSSPTPSSPTQSPNHGQERPDLTPRGDDEESEHGVLVEDIGPDLQEELANLWKRADAQFIIGLEPLPSKCSSQQESKPTSNPSSQDKPGSPSKQSNQDPNSPTSPSKLSNQVKTGECRGGGGGPGGSNYHVWLRLAERIMEGVRRAQLPLRLPLDDITEGDGNCYFRAVCSQLQRLEVAAPDHFRRLDHLSLRRKVCNFMLKSRLKVVENFKRNWYDFRLGDYDQWWMAMAESKGNIWAEGPVIHATAWFLERDIYVVSEQATLGDPFLPFSGNQDGSEAACAGAALWLGHLTGLHYQTLMPLPTERESMPPRPKLREVEETLQAKVQGTGSGGDQQTSLPGPSRVGEVSLIHFLWILSSKC